MWCRSVAVALFLLPSACAFVPHRPLAVDGGSRTTTSLSMSASPPEDFMKRSQKVKSVLEDDEKPPKLFEDDLLEDMRESLLKLETRVKGGPGSLSMEEVDEFEAATQRILKEMKEFNASGGNTSPPGASSNAPANVVPSAPVPSSSVAADSTSPPTLAQTPIKTTPLPGSPTEPASRTTLQPGETVVRGENDQVTDTSLDEGPAYDGKGGMGLAKGTANTYIIPGMDEMSPEEYRKALQKSVSDRQTRRHSNRGGMVGNRAAHQYLDNLGWGGASSNLAGNTGGDDEDSDEDE